MKTLLRFHELNRHYQDNRAWKLLRKSTAPIILAFIEQLFAQSSISRNEARIQLDTYKQTLDDYWNNEAPASYHLNEWLNEGWLREHDGQLSKTDACETALRFCRNLTERTTATSGSHLRIVQNHIRDLAAALSADPDTRLAIIAQQIQELQQEADNIKQHGITPLSDAQAREMLNEAYRLCADLSQDFRHVEEETRKIDKTLRSKIIEENSHRGDVLKHWIEQAEALQETEAGSAFSSFYALLAQKQRTDEFREQLRQIVQDPRSSKYLSDKQRHHFKTLLSHLNREGDRIFTIRRDTAENLKQFIESGAAAEHHASAKLLKELAQLALNLRRADLPLDTAIPLPLNSGKANTNTPFAYRLLEPSERINPELPPPVPDNDTPTADTLAEINPLPIHQIAAGMKTVLQQHGSLSLAGISQHYPITLDLGELTARIRIAQAVGAAELPERENIDFHTRTGKHYRASIPTLWLTAAQIPDNLDGLDL